jgi:hypothetical protein
MNTSDIVSQLLTEAIKNDSEKLAQNAEPYVEYTYGDAKDRTTIKCPVSKFEETLVNVEFAKSQAQRKVVENKSAEPKIVAVTTEAQGSL